MTKMAKAASDQLGFTLIEAIIVMVITAILSAAVALFLRRPFEQYRDLTDRAILTDAANTAIRRISRDIHLALPNSVRSANANCIEFIPTYDGSRYRTTTDSLGVGNPFTTASAITQFDVIGPLNVTPVIGDFVVVYNLGIPGADAYAPSDNRGTIVAPVSTTLMTIASKQFPYASPSNRFHLVSGTDQAVSYVCASVGVDANGRGTGTLYRTSGYGFIYPEPAACATINAGTPILAQNVKTCSFTYTPGIIERSGMVSLQIGLARNAQETVSLYQEVSINNVP